jgi:diacylglycerol kinase (CTP)
LEQTQSLGSFNMMAEFKKRSDMHWARKIWHMAGVSAMTLLYCVLPNQWALTLMVSVLVPALILDFVRLRNSEINKTVFKIFKPIMRESEAKSLAGTTYLLSGVTVVLFLFPREVVIPALLFLAFADPLASFFGIRFGKDKIFGHKSVQGTLAAFIICATLLGLYLYLTEMLIEKIFIVSILGGIIGALAELVPIGKMDDNFTLPILSAIGLYLTFFLFGAF